MTGSFWQEFSKSKRLVLLFFLVICLLLIVREKYAVEQSTNSLLKDPPIGKSDMIEHSENKVKKTEHVAEESKIDQLPKRTMQPFPWTECFKDEDLALVVSELELRGALKGSSRFVVDIGCNDGEGPTKPFFQNNYAGLCVEGDSEHLPALNKKFPSPNVIKKISWITPKTIPKIFLEAQVPKDFYFMKMDIDADDCAQLVVLFELGFRPRVLQVELNPEIPNPIAFGVLPLPTYAYRYHYGFQCCSLALMKEIASRYNYRLFAIGGTKDAIFVLDDTLKRAEEKELSIDTANNLYYKCCAYHPPNPTKFIGMDNQIIQKAEISPLNWYSAARESGGDKQKLAKVESSVKNIVEEACKKRAADLLHDQSSNDIDKCKLKYIVGSNAKLVADEFIQRTKDSL